VAKYGELPAHLKGTTQLHILIHRKHGHWNDIKIFLRTELGTCAPLLCWIMTPEDGAGRVEGADE